MAPVGFWPIGMVYIACGLEGKMHQFSHGRPFSLCIPFGSTHFLIPHRQHMFEISCTHALAIDFDDDDIDTHSVGLIHANSELLRLPSAAKYGPKPAK